MTVPLLLLALTYPFCSLCIAPFPHQAMISEIMDVLDTIPPTSNSVHTRLVEYMDDRGTLMTTELPKPLINEIHGEEGAGGMSWSGQVVGTVWNRDLEEHAAAVDEHV